MFAAAMGRRANFALVFASLLGAAAACLAQNAALRADAALPEVLVQAERQRQADQEVTRQAEKILATDPWIFGDHITVTTEHGVVRVEGIVGDTGEMFRIVRLCRKIPGARRIVNALEMMHNDPDGG
jgi:osmotically-inducible protein OsmY